MQATSTMVSTRTTGPYWRILKFAAGFLKIIAVLIAVLGIGAAVLSILASVGKLSGALPVVMPGGNLLLGILVAVGILLGTLINFLFFYASSELILVLVAIEKNTRPRTF